MSAAGFLLLQQVQRQREEREREEREQAVADRQKVKR